MSVRIRRTNSNTFFFSKYQMFKCLCHTFFFAFFLLPLFLLLWHSFMDKLSVIFTLSLSDRFFFIFFLCHIRTIYPCFDMMVDMFFFSRLPNSQNISGKLHGSSMRWLHGKLSWRAKPWLCVIEKVMI